MWKIIVIIIVVAIIDLRKISFKEKKKEVVIYFGLCLLTVILGIYYHTPNYISFSEFVFNIMLY